METIERKLVEYTKYIQEHQSALNEGSAKKANRIHGKIVLLAKQIAKSNRMDIFIPFLKNQNEHIKLWTASICLRTYTELAMNALEELSESKDFMINFKAKAILRLYESGKWDEISLL